LSILRDDRLVALHDLVEACHASAHLYALAAELMADDPRAADLQALADKRGGSADFFSERMIEAGDIPAGPPEERNLLEGAVARAKAVFTETGRVALLADCRARDEAVLERAEPAQTGPLRDDEKDAANELAGDVREQLRGLLKS